MSISAQYLQFKGFAIAPDDVSLGEAESQEVAIVRNGRLIKVNLVRKSLSIRLRGLLQSDAEPFVQLASGNKVGLILGSAPTEDMTLGLHSLKDAVLTKAVPSLPVNFAGSMVISELQLEYTSLEYV